MMSNPWGPTTTKPAPSTASQRVTCEPIPAP